MDHRTTSLKFLHSTGLIPVKVRPGQKDPFPEWDPRTVALLDHSVVLEDLRHKPDLNIGALFAGRYIDIDVDGNSPFLTEALDYFLPRTPYVWGRKSKPKSHRVYALFEDFDRGPYGPILRFIKGLEKDKIDGYSYSVEVRGGKPENGLFSVLPGSIHPSKEPVTWSEEIDPTMGGAVVEFAKLLRSIRLALVAAIIAPHWGPGVRNDMSLALAGTLWRIRTSTLAAFGLGPEEEPPESVYVLDQADAEALFTVIMQLSGDKHGDERQRMLNLKNTWRKLDGQAGAKVTGGKVLAELVGPEIGERIVRSLYRLLSDNDAAETIEKLSEQFVMWYGQGVLIDLHMVANNRSNPWMTNLQAQNSLGGKSVTIGDVKVPIHKILFTSTIINRVYGLTFDPSTMDMLVSTNEGLMVNQWRGFSVVPSEQKVSEPEIRMFRDYVIRVLANNNEEHAHWLFAWMADMLRFPHKKPGTALVLVGVEGAGKTFLGEHILGKIVGPTHYSQTNSVTTLTHNFNTIIDNKIFIQCDEAVHSYQRDIASRLKSIITDESVIIEPKGINSYKKPNHMRFLFTSNEEAAAIFISPSPYERRFTVLRVSPEFARNEQYWNDMRLWTPQALPKIMRWLLDYSYERWLVMRPIETEAKKTIQKTSVEVEVSWILARIAEGFPLGDRSHAYWFEAYMHETLQQTDKDRNIRRRDEWPDRIMFSALEDDFRAYTRSMGKQVYSGSLATTIKKVLPPGTVTPYEQKTVRYVDSRSNQVTNGRIRLHTFPSVDEIMTYLKTRYGPVVEDVVEEFKAAADPDKRGEF